jgi:ATP-dependent Clp protease ATP-binding subunit ClpC
LSKERIRDRRLPDKALDALDEAAAMVKVSHVQKAIPAVLYKAAVAKRPELGALWKEVQEIDRDILKEKSGKKKAAMVEQREALERSLQGYGVITVDADDIEKIINEWTHDI